MSMGLSGAAAIVGIAESDYVRGATATVPELVFDVSMRAIADAGLKPSDIDGVWIEPVSAQAQRQGDGSWRIKMVAAVPGRWTLSLGILISDFDKVTITAPVLIR